MSVVLRCPTCGTTRPTPGDCEACHEAQVRYFCTNHTPGLWLDVPTCPQCGARFGEARRAPTPLPVPPARTRPTAPARSPASPPPAPAYARDEPRPSSPDEWELRDSLPADRGEGLALAPPPWRCCSKFSAELLALAVDPRCLTARGRGSARAYSAVGFKWSSASSLCLARCFCSGGNG